MNRVRVLFADQLNLARGKYISQKFAQKGAVRFCVGTYALTYQRNLIDAPGAGLSSGLPDMEAVFKPTDMRQGWEADTAVVLADLEENGTAHGLCGRGALRSAIRAWNERGLNPMVGMESEAYIFQRNEQGDWIPYDTPGAFVYGAGAFVDPAGLIDVIWRAAEANNIAIESINSEFDFPQFELTLGYSDALRACDDFFLFRTMARELLYQRGFLLCFLPKPIADKSGTGLHLNISFNDKNGQNVLADATQPDALSDLVKGSIAGLLHHHRAMGGLLAPLVNSYARLQPATLSGYWANWGFDHRSVAVRLSAEGGAAARIEHRLADCAVSPYVAVAAALRAALLGVENGYPLPDAERGDGFDNVNTNISVAHSLSDSLDALAADKPLTKAIGQLLVDNYIAIKRAEITELEGASEKEIFDYYAPFI